MYDYGLGVLEQYNLTAQKTARIRGGLLCNTGKENYIIKEFRGSEKKLHIQQSLQKQLENKGINTDCYVENIEKNLVSVDKENDTYTVQKWSDSRECDIYAQEEILLGAEVLAKLHLEMKLDFCEEYMERSLEEEYIRHNQELRKIRKFIRRKGSQNSFERLYMESIETFLANGVKAEHMLEQSSYHEMLKQVRKKGWISHGNFNQHNIRFGNGIIIVTGFEKWSFGIQISDLYFFMRKILEKYNWDIVFAEKILNSYRKIREISEEEWEHLKIRFSYPEKYWKIANYYFSHNKVLIPEKNTQKLRKIVEQECVRKKFLEQWLIPYIDEKR